MKIWHVTSEVCAPPTLHGGMGVHVWNVAREQVKMGHDVSVFCPLRAEREVEGVRFRPWEYVLPRCDSKLAFTLLMGQATIDKLVPIAREERPDVIHGHEWDAASVYLRIAEFSRIPCVGTLHISNWLNAPYMTPEFSEQDRYFMWWEQEFLRRCDGIIAISKYFEDFIKWQRCKVPLKQIYNGVDVEAFKGGPEVKRPEADIVGFFHGRLVGQKGMDLIIQTLDEYPEVHFVLAGGFAASESGDCLEDDIFRNLKRLEREGRCTLLGLVDQPTVGSWLKACDVAVYPHHNAPFDCAVLEAMACGAAVVCSPVDALLEYTREGVNTIHIDMPMDPDKIVVAMREAKRIRRVLGKNASMHTAHLTWEACAKEAVEFYKEILYGKDSAYKSTGTNTHKANGVLRNGGDHPRGELRASVCKVSSWNS